VYLQQIISTLHQFPVSILSSFSGQTTNLGNVYSKNVSDSLVSFKDFLKHNLIVTIV
jgi:hypothetical protein